jgi:outer membrane scaffolding protein for murein synthesis (MipA/OmpV family)
VEVGPSLDIKLWHSPTKDMQLRLFLPMRAAYTLEHDPQYIGWQFAPRLNLDIAQPLGLQGWTLGTVAGPIYGSPEQHTYFYAVAPQFSSPTRSSYSARGGYAGVQMISALWKRFPEFWVGGFIRYDNLSGAVFEDSPLVTQKSRFSGGLAVAWVLGKSSQMVPVD